ncbi:hypothetical protein BK727_16965 [Bacillus thuringiensis serovar roskildiensis]|uniref:Cyanobacterial TRADD-N associated 2 transmembrane domain-containing protein n=1 Tax=Bacillus thuringiensis serovar sooncheon TaxID=180891 RepID=A0A9Q5SF61_BACTU|nr:hypothetical protein [Bacillus thuringiensis]OTW67880.1 hypothetical protein BK707_22265 [Bacillus thuringiensis serovar coreanensis]OTX44497.1 hypothetical protein BK724_17560 [Bacillus thuringiensis serovar sooncheon]OTX53660.1 hypothetical protein BK725_15945 [Bacillus thuringiensis serovar guiyangiensis]OTX67981.1 hypothetical protein BK727_16965 [Bacillus thuringiensis serovar roskildiensis]
MTETFVNTVTERKVALEEKRNELKEKMSKRKEKGRASILFAIISLAISIALFFVLPKIFEFNPWRGLVTPVISFVCFVYAIMFSMVPIIRRPSEHIMELQEIENELDLLSISHSSLEERSEKLFKHHHLELKRYYDENLKQSSWIFIVGIVCIGIGFAIIGLTLYFLIANLSNELENKIIVASVGAIGAILSNFIAVIYLKMHAETVKALTEFHNRFVNTHHFYFSNFLLSKIQNEDKREDALVELALKINGISPKALAQGEESK